MKCDAPAPNLWVAGIRSCLKCIATKPRDGSGKLLAGLRFVCREKTGHKM